MFELLYKWSPLCAHKSGRERANFPSDSVEKNQRERKSTLGNCVSAGAFTNQIIKVSASTEDDAQIRGSGQQRSHYALATGKAEAAAFAITRDTNKNK